MDMKALDVLLFVMRLMGFDHNTIGITYDLAFGWIVDPPVIYDSLESVADQLRGKQLLAVDFYHHRLTLRDYGGHAREYALELVPVTN